MKGRILTKKSLSNFINNLRLEEKSANTIEKYKHDVRVFSVFLNDKAVCKKLVIEYKQKLITDGYAVSRCLPLWTACLIIWNGLIAR